MSIKSLKKSLKKQMQRMQQPATRQIDRIEAKVKSVGETEQLRRALDSLFSLYEKSPTMHMTRSEITAKEAKDERARVAREAKAAKKAQKEALKQKRQLNASKARSTRLSKSPFPSSWVHKIGYDPKTKTLSAKLGRRMYYWSPIEQDEFDEWARADYKCRTDDPSGRRRWYPDKTPSMGATWHQFVKSRVINKRK